MSKLNDNRLIDILPPNMTSDTIKSLSFAIDKQHLRLVNHIEKVLILANIDNVGTTTLDAISLDMGVDDYDILLSHTTKLELFKENVFCNKFTKGTSKTVARAVGILYGSASVIEWYNTDLDPYEFKIRAQVPINGESLEHMHGKITRVVSKAKNVRSHLAGITFFQPSTARIYTAMHHTIATTIAVAPYLLHDISTVNMPVIRGYVKCGMRLQISAGKEQK